jgi:hypothetical protein
LATTYYSADCTAGSGVQPRAGKDRGIVHKSETYTGTANMVTSDVFQMVKIPKGAVVLDLIVAVTTKTDTGSNTILHVGDGVDTDRYHVQAAAVDNTTYFGRMNTAASMSQYVYTADDTIDIIVATDPETSTTDFVLSLTVFYTFDV